MCSGVSICISKSCCAPVRATCLLFNNTVILWSGLVWSVFAEMGAISDVWEMCGLCRREPVVLLETGQSYERSAIENWYSK